MKLIKCGHCGRPYYDDSETCPYCGHVPGSSPQTADTEQEAIDDSADVAAQAIPASDTAPADCQPETITPVADTGSPAEQPTASQRAESIAAAVASAPLIPSG